MAVHLQIAEQVKKHRGAQKEFIALDALREEKIITMLEKAKKTGVIDVSGVNDVTNSMNAIATQFYFPTRKIVTIEMVQNYLSKQN